MLIQVKYHNAQKEIARVTFISAGNARKSFSQIKTLKPKAFSQTYKSRSPGNSKRNKSPLNLKCILNSSWYNVYIHTHTLWSIQKPISYVTIHFNIRKSGLFANKFRSTDVSRLAYCKFSLYFAMTDNGFIILFSLKPK